MARRKKAQQAESYEERAEEILHLASSLPQSYREKLLQDLRQMNSSTVQKEHQGENCHAQELPSEVNLSGETRRRSRRTPKKTAKLVEFMKATVKTEKPDCDNNFSTMSECEQQSSTPDCVDTKCQETVNDTIAPSSFLSASADIGSDPEQNVASESLSQETDEQCQAKRKHDPESTSSTRRSTQKKTKLENFPDGTCDVDLRYDHVDNHNHSAATQYHDEPLDIAENCQPVSCRQLKSERDVQETESDAVIYIAIKHEPTSFDVLGKVTSDPDQEAQRQEITHTVSSDTSATTEITEQEAKAFLDTFADSDKLQSKEIEYTSENLPVGDHEGNISDVVPRRKRKPKCSSLPSCYSCPECHLELPTRDSLRAHIAEKHKGSFKCETCGQIFRYRHTYQKHVSIHDSGDFHKCPHCANMIKGKDRLEAHIQQVHVELSNCKKKYHNCLECGEQFRSLKKLADHKLNIHGRHSFQCGLCGRRYRYRAPYTQHMAEHELKLLTKCSYDLCTFHYKNETEYLSHVARVHEKNAPRPHMCDICSQSFTETRYLKAHMKCHEKEKRFVCETCMFEARTVQSLKTHLERKHSMTLAHVCELCGAKLSSKAGLEQHVKRHYNKRDQVCQDCGKTFVSKGQLAAHMKTHTNRSFECNVCAKGFVNKFKLASHMLTHSKEKNFQCNHCSYRCNLKSNLYKHSERVHRVAHPDKFTKYRYVQKVQPEIQFKPMVERLQLVDVAPKLTVGEGDQEQEWTNYDEPVMPTTASEQTEAAHVLAQMQTGQLIVQDELGAEPNDEKEVLQAANADGQIDPIEYIKCEDGQSVSTEEVVVDSMESMYHVVEDCEVEEQEGSEDAMYMLQLEGMSDTLAVRASDMDALTSGSVITVNDETVLMVDTSSVHLQP